MSEDTSEVLRVKHGAKETTTSLLEADNMSVRVDSETGEAVLELFRYGNNGRALESYQMRLCREDRERLRSIL